MAHRYPMKMVSPEASRKTVVAAQAAAASAALTTSAIWVGDHALFANGVPLHLALLLSAGMTGAVTYWVGYRTRPSETDQIEIDPTATVRAKAPST